MPYVHSCHNFKGKYLKLIWNITEKANNSPVTEQPIKQAVQIILGQFVSYFDKKEM